MELRDVWLGKGQGKPAQEPETSDAIMPAGAPADTDAADQNPQTSSGPGTGVSETKKAKEVRELNAYLKQLNAKTNLLDLTSEVLGDEKLLSYGWMTLDFAMNLILYA